MKLQKGFTLIELMVVIAIIALLAAIGAVVYSSAQQNGRDSKRMQDAQEIQKAIEQYYAINNSYPDDIAGVVKTEAPDAIAGLASYFQGGVVPKDPNSAQPYSYTAGSPGSSCTGGAVPHYVICTKLENCGGGKCNRGSLSGLDGCQSANDAITPAKYYCVAP